LDPFALELPTGPLSVVGRV
jgi:hypothetical protein